MVWIAFALAMLSSVCAISPANWMHEASALDPRFAAMSLWDMTVPGTHDTLSYDLSSELTELASTPFGAGDIVRNFAVTQTTSVTQQLEAGIRFLDFRVMRSPDGEWYGTHTVRTRKPALDYVREIARWLDGREGEYLMVFLSRHGAECLKGDSQYPRVSVREKQKFWSRFEDAARGYLMPAQRAQESIGALRATRRSGMFVMATDYAEMTGNSSMALDACIRLNNTGGGGRPSHSQYLDDKAYMHDLMSPSRHRGGGKYYLRSMASAASRQEVVSHMSAVHLVPPRWRALAHSECVHSYGLPMPSGYCAGSLPALGTFCNFYNRRVLLDYMRSGARPNAFYVDMVSVSGGMQASGVSEFDFYGLVMVMNIDAVCSGGCTKALIDFASMRAGNWSLAWPNSSKLGLTSVPPMTWA